MKRSLVLCGFMGCGKTTVGKRLAKLTGRKFIDTDVYITEQANMTIPKIFEKYGEEYFRELEYLACQYLSSQEQRIISTGGGMILQERNLRELKKGGLIVYLEINPETAIYRLKHDKTRPLLQRPDRDRFIRNLYEKRVPFYSKAADITVDATQTPDFVALQIMKDANIL